ncbi:hypothetical protein EGW08_002147 [Elysia chlorotica]|uniref:Uncharacterized protein n=1 Tax=Elysia chlorotica TaxID=188477 RepID=A0A3S1I0Z7_ELYCH|nr:hypothetical protein EGW08_002147 [Elysia chlorotica]
MAQYRKAWILAPNTRPYRLLPLCLARSFRLFGQLGSTYMARGQGNPETWAVGGWATAGGNEKGAKIGKNEGCPRIGLAPNWQCVPCGMSLSLALTLRLIAGLYGPATTDKSSELARKRRESKRSEEKRSPTTSDQPGDTRDQPNSKQMGSRFECHNHTTSLALSPPGSPGRYRHPGIQASRHPQHPGSQPSNQPRSLSFL